MDSIDGIEWRIGEGLVAYADSLAEMEVRAAAVRAGTAPELVWLLEHPPLFTAGTSADPAELFNPLGFPVHDAGRGGRYTYHGPGQRVARSCSCSVQGEGLLAQAEIVIAETINKLANKIGLGVFFVDKVVVPRVSSLEFSRV